MNRNTYLVFAIILFLLSDYSFAEKLYKWVDKDGVVHITDKPEEIPEEHVGTIEEIDIERTDYKSMIGNLWKNVRKQKENIIFSIILLILFIFVFKSFKHLKSSYIKKRKKKLLYTLDKSGIDDMNRDEFKVYIIKLLEAQGFSTQSIDEEQTYRGIRLMAEKNKTKFLVHIIPEIDLGSSLAVNEVEREKHRYGCTKSMLISKHFFADDAIKLANKRGCELVDRFVLAEWIT
ncbi:MAG: restriction endonuclease [Thermodesulfobacteriota bacterium]